jgi:hypothetical protein
VALQGVAMNKPNVPWWSSMGFRRAEPIPDTDYADMGTAFGLDASLGPAEDMDAKPAGDEGPSTDRLNRRSVI